MQDPINSRSDSLSAQPALPSGSSSQIVTLLAETEYIDCSADGSPLRIHMRPDAVDGIARDVMENERTEVGGLLFGTVENGDRLIVRIDRFQRILFTGAFDYQALEEAAAAILRSGELSVIGVYRSHKRPGFQLEPSDFQVVERYFADPSDLVLLIKPESATDLAAQFFAHGPNGAIQAAGPLFPFRGRALKPARLVPDFVPLVEFPTERSSPPPVSRVKKWWPAAAAIALVAGTLWLVVPALRQPESKIQTEANRPLGLSVQPSGQAWSISWNPNASALHDAHGVQLFVKDADDQKRIELSPRDLASGTYLYQPAGNDVTFRLEVNENSGRVSAESFRIMRTPAPPVIEPPAKIVVPPRAIHKTPAVVSASIRPRIKGKIQINVRVHVDDRGRVTSAEPVEKRRTGLESYLAARAVEAARGWRFEPARENGKAVAGEQTIHFVFGK